MKEWKKMRILMRRVTGKARFINICQSYSYYSHMMNLFNISKHDVICNKFKINQIRSNTIVLDKADNWNKLPFKEALLIKSYILTLINTILKTSKELHVLNFIPPTSHKQFLASF